LLRGAARLASVKNWRSLRENQLPAAHEHSAFLQLYKGIGWMTRLCRSSWKSSAGLDRQGVPASVRQPLPAPDVDEAGEHARSARFIADSVSSRTAMKNSETCVVGKLEPTGRKIAISGAGPAGLTAAFYLAMLGHEVTVYEQVGSGGMLRFALPEYRCESGAAARIELIERSA